MHRDNIEKLLDIMARLRSPRGGCPWDLEQRFETIAPYTIEEAYEVADAIERGDLDDLREELGDLLFQVVYHARLAEEIDAFDFGDVVAAICAKLVRRHPHVFGDASIADARAQSAAWERLKAEEKPGRRGALGDIPKALPALSQSAKLGRRASRVGFDWPELDGARAKIDEELDELDEAVARGVRADVEAELGDLLFAVVNACRHLDVDPETSLRAANRRFRERFARVEQAVERRGGDWSAFSLEELDAFWTAAKQSGS